MHKVRLYLPKLLFVNCALFIVFFLSLAASADEYLKDVPKGHWANEAVYTLIRLGVTSGYPDGTYRGEKNLSRFEAASFISRFAQSLRRQSAIDDKMLAELRSEVESLKFERQQGLQTSGVVDSRMGYATLPAHQGRLDFRFIGNLARSFDEDTSCKMTLDTLDAGYGTMTTRSITTNMLDVE
ncbi:MAG: S-layer homology domain-containing protein, partial [Candidatus Margulisiibacteriota bacterium]